MKSDPSSGRIPSVRYPGAGSSQRSKGRLLRDEVVITSDGRPKARLVPVRDESRPYTVDWAWLESQPLVGGPSAEAIIAADRSDRCP
ncbi:MAG: hypothetical protein LW626_07840 [Verrucomicrobium sp.]|nr:hypothetical protein [Verrucomicrobium sp.]